MLSREIQLLHVGWRTGLSASLAVMTLEHHRASSGLPRGCGGSSLMALQAATPWSGQEQTQDPRELPVLRMRWSLQAQLGRPPGSVTHELCPLVASLSTCVLSKVDRDLHLQCSCDITQGLWEVEANLYTHSHC